MNRRAFLKMIAAAPLAALLARYVKPKKLTDEKIEELDAYMRANQRQTPYSVFDGKGLVVDSDNKLDAVSYALEGEWSYHPKEGLWASPVYYIEDKELLEWSVEWQKKQRKNQKAIMNYLAAMDKVRNAPKA